MASYKPGTKRFSQGQLVIWLTRTYGKLPDGRYDYANPAHSIHEGLLVDAKTTYSNVMSRTGELKSVNRNDMYHDSPEARAFLEAWIAHDAAQTKAQVAASEAANRAREAAYAPHKPLIDTLRQTLSTASKALPQEDGGPQGY